MHIAYEEHLNEQEAEFLAPTSGHHLNDHFVFVSIRSV